MGRNQEEIMSVRELHNLNSSGKRTCIRCGKEFQPDWTKRNLCCLAEVPKKEKHAWVYKEELAETYRNRHIWKNPLEIYEKEKTAHLMAYNQGAGI